MGVLDLATVGEFDCLLNGGEAFVVFEANVTDVASAILAGIDDLT